MTMARAELADSDDNADPGLPQASLRLLANLAVPLWILNGDGAVVWLNVAARTLLQLPPPDSSCRYESEPLPVPAHVIGSLAVSDTPRDSAVCFRSGAGEVRLRCHVRRLESAETGRPAVAPVRLLLEAVPDAGPDAATYAALQQDVERLNEQLVALAFAYPDLRFEMARDGTILDFAAADPTDLVVPPERFLNRRAREVLPVEVAQRLEAAIASLDDATGDITGFTYSLPVAEGVRHYECRLVPLGDDQRLMVVIRNITARCTAEAALKASEARYRALVEAIPDLVVVIDRNGHVCDIVSPKDSRATENRNHWLGQSINTLLDSETAQRFLAHIHETLDNRTPHIHEYWHEYGQSGHKGHVRYYQAHSVPYGTDTVLSVIRDISDQQRSREMLAQREAQFRILLENAGDIILVVVPDGTIRYESPSLARLLGTVSTHSMTAPRHIFGVVHPDDQMVVARALKQFETAPPGSRHTLAFRVSGARGVVMLESVCTNLCDTPLVGGIVINARDVSEMRQAEQSAERAHKMLLSAIDSISEGFELYDAEDRLVICNNRSREIYPLIAEMFVPGTSFRDLLWQNIIRGQLPEAVGQEEHFINARMRRHQEGQVHFEQYLPGERWILVEEQRTWDGGTVVLRTDITERKRHEAEVRAAHAEADLANRRKSDYVHHLSHELRTPLTAVLGFSQIIAEDLMGNGPGAASRYRDYAGQIVIAGQYMLDLVNNILDIAKIEAGRMEVNDDACNLALLIDMTLNLLHPRAQEAGVRLEMECSAGLPELSADINLLRQMLTNLTANAIKFCPREQGRVVVAAVCTEDGGVDICVRDNGVGMSAEQIPRALEMFSQVHDPAIASDKGSGLGLPLTRALIELHGGTLHLESAPGSGTTVTLRFPPTRIVNSTD